MQPRAQVGIGCRLSTAEPGLRYEIKRQFALYIGVSCIGNVAGTADFVRAEGNDPSSFVVIGGLQLWF